METADKLALIGKNLQVSQDIEIAHREFQSTFKNEIKKEYTQQWNNLISTTFLRYHTKAKNM